MKPFCTFLTGQNVNFGDTYIAIGLNNDDEIITYNNSLTSYYTYFEVPLGNIIDINNYDNNTQTYELHILDTEYVPIIDNCDYILIMEDEDSFTLNISKNSNNKLRVNIMKNNDIPVTNISSINDFNIVDYMLDMSIMISSNDKIVWREPGFWDVISARTGFVTTTN